MSRFSRALAMAAALLLAVTAATGCAPSAQTVTITIHYSAFAPAEITVPRGVPITFVLANEDPIDHEWLVGDAAFHDQHRRGTHASHGGVPTEVSIPALETVQTTITFDEAGSFAYVCHLPSHESYGMAGTLTVDG